MLTDNGAIFTAETRHGRCAMENELARLGIAYKHSRPYHPQTCGKVERFHQTLKKHLARQPKAATLSELQAQLDRFRTYYNGVRPHRAIGRRTPAEAFGAKTKAVPRLPPLVVEGHHRVRRDRVDKTGTVTLRYRSKLLHIGVGRAHAGTRVLLLVADLDVRIMTDDGELLRHLTLDPTKDYQSPWSAPVRRWVLEGPPGCLATTVRDVSRHNRAERVGFEPTVTCATTVFEPVRTHGATSPFVELGR